MTNRQAAIEKIEAWARWEAGNTPDKNPGLGLPVSPGFIPGDQADHLTVEIALKEFGAADSMKDLLRHVYGHDLLPDSFEPFEPLPPPARRGVKHFLKSYGWGARAFTTASLRRFVRFLAERLGNI